MSELREKCAKALCAMEGQTPNCLEAIWCIPEADAKLIDGDINNFPARYVWRGYTDRADAVLSIILEEAAKVARGDIYKERYRIWSFWPGNRSSDSELVRFADALANAIRALNNKVQG